MKLGYILILFIYGNVLGNLVRNVRLVDHISYIIDVVSKTIEEVEAREWCNLRIPDADPIGLDEIILGWHARGNISYTNGFVISIQGIDILRQSVNQQVNLNGNREAQAIVRGTLRMHDVAIGYDVHANLEDSTHRYTAKYVYPLVNMDFIITKILESDIISVTVAGNVLNRRTLPYFMPNDRLSDALTTLFDPAMSTNGIIAWGTNVFEPIAKKVITTHINFPEICYNCAL